MMETTIDLILPQRLALKSLKKHIALHNFSILLHIEEYQEKI